MKRMRDILAIGGGGGLIFAAYSTYTGNEKFYEHVTMPVVHMFDAERIHKLAVKCVQYKLIRKATTPDPPVLQTQVFGRRFSNPIGMAAGFDKQAEAVDGLFKMGFGFVEVGTVTPEPQPGNAKPRVFRLHEDRAVINRYGFNSEGHQAVYKRLTERQKSLDKSKTARRRYKHYMDDDRNMLNLNFWMGKIMPSDIDHKKENLILGVNLGKNRTSPNPVDDYVRGVSLFSPLADYLVINISSPNTPGLREMQGRQQLHDLLNKVVAEHNKIPESKRPPVLVKIAPDLTRKDKEDIAAVISNKNCGVQGLIVSNTTIRREDELLSKHRNQSGGLSGEPLRELSTDCIHEMYFLTGGKELSADCIHETYFRVERCQLLVWVELAVAKTHMAKSVPALPLSNFIRHPFTILNDNLTGLVLIIGIDEVPIIGVGGVSNGQDAYDKIRAGASLIQLYTSFIYLGPPVVGKIKRELAQLLERDGFTSVSEAVGHEHEHPTDDRYT